MSENFCDEREKLCAERFGRDKERLGKLEDLTAKTSECVIKLSEIARQSDGRLTDHEKRLDELEHRPAGLWDKVTSGMVAAAVAFLMSAVLK